MSNFIGIKRGRGNGRNNRGVITVRNRGGGSRRKIRDVKTSYCNGEAGIIRLVGFEYDANRTGEIGIIREGDKDRLVIIGKNMRVGGLYKSIRDEDSRVGEVGKEGDEIEVGMLNVGRMVYNIDGKYSRSGGSYGVLIGKGERCRVRLSSKEEIELDCKTRVRIGSVGIGKKVERRRRMVVNLAGRSRWLGRRPRVRKIAKNAVDR